MEGKYAIRQQFKLKQLAIGTLLIIALGTVTACGGDDSTGGDNSQDSGESTEINQELAMQGEDLFGELGCAGCHSLSGQRLVGPALDGLYLNTVELASGETVTADDSYLKESINDPDAKIVNGFPPGSMSAAISMHQDRISQGQNLDALVEFIKRKR